VKGKTCKESDQNNATSEHPGVFHKLLKVNSISVPQCIISIINHVYCWAENKQ